MANEVLIEALDALDKAIKEAGGAQALAKKWKVTPQYLYMVRNEDTPPSRKLLKRLGFDIQKQYVRVDA